MSKMLRMLHCFNDQKNQKMYRVLRNIRYVFLWLMKNLKPRLDSDKHVLETFTYKKCIETVRKTE